MSCIVACGLVPLLQAQTTVRISVAPGNVEADDVSIGASISADGRFVAFQSSATNLVLADTNGVDDVFVRDRMTDATHRVSVHSFGIEGDGPSGAATIAANGRFVAFDSLATNLVAGDTNNRRDVFVHDRLTLSTQRVSLGAGGIESDGASSAPSLSADGRYVAFQSRGTNLVAGDTNGVSDVFVLDRQSGITLRASVDSAGLQASGASDSCSISASGDRVVFRSVATDLVLNDQNGKSDIFLRELSSVTTLRVSLASGGVEVTGDSHQPRISADGNIVVFQSDAFDLVSGDLNLETDVFRHTLASGVTERASVGAAGVEGDGASGFAQVTGDGARVVFHSQATNLVALDVNGVWDVFVHDFATSITQRVSVDSGGVEADNSSGAPALSANGRFIAFASLAANLAPGDTNGVNDIFLRDLLDPAVMNYCTAGTTANGCNAAMSATGVASASGATSFMLLASSVEGEKSGMFFYGLTGRLELPWGAGSSFRCVNPPVQRIPQQGSGGMAGQCDGSLTLDWNAYVAAHPSANGVPFSAGDIVDVQAWFRDPPSPQSTSLSDALEFVVVP
jgi:Tol biopolymer transport system component